MSTQIGNIHDAFFKRVMGEPSLAGAFLREHLPAEVAELLGPEPPEPVAGSFVDEELREHHSDLLFRVQLKEGPQAFTYVLMEHKSTPDRGGAIAAVALCGAGADGLVRTEWSAIATAACAAAAGESGAGGVDVFD